MKTGVSTTKSRPTTRKAVDSSFFVGWALVTGPA
jgi:hypothetical protein